VKYLDALVRGAYAKRNLKKGDSLSDQDVYLAVPLQKGQLSCREIMRGEILLKDLIKDQPLMIDSVDTPYAYDTELKNFINQRGLE
jgi:N-acetylneuraminate synthase